MAEAHAPGGQPAENPAQPQPATDDAARAHQEKLDRALSRGERELPPNQVKGILGERGLNVGKVDEFKPDLNSGISQEVDLPVVWMAIVLLFLTVILAPVGVVVLWRTRLISHRAKVIWTVVAVLWVIGVVTYARFR